MQITRRDFLKYCGISAAAIGISTSELGLIEEALAASGAPKVVWLQGAGCTGCSVSFLNRISTSEPNTAADVLIESIDLVYHPNLMALAGQDAVDQARSAYDEGNFVLIIEGGIPTAYGGAPCFAWTYNGVDVTFAEAVSGLVSRASKVVCIGNCAAWGGMSAAPPNPTGVKGVKAATGKTTINVPGCPPHPDWMVWAIVQILLGNNIAVDSYGRPTAICSRTVHDRCPLHETDETHSFGVSGRCLKELGCRGPKTRANCPTQLWNGRVSWCIGANAPCIGCTEPTFPSAEPFYRMGEDDD